MACMSKTNLVSAKKFSLEIFEDLSTATKSTQFSSGKVCFAGCRLQVAGRRLQVAGCRLQVAGCGLQVAGCRLKFNYNWKTADT